MPDIESLANQLFIEMLESDEFDQLTPIERTALCTQIAQLATDYAKDENDY